MAPEAPSSRAIAPDVTQVWAGAIARLRAFCGAAR
jgi:hypothetical protein